jgi:hypothetical protein
MLTMLTVTSITIDFPTSGLPLIPRTKQTLPAVEKVDHCRVAFTNEEQSIAHKSNMTENCIVLVPTIRQSKHLMPGAKKPRNFGVSLQQREAKVHFTKSLPNPIS